MDRNARFKMVETPSRGGLNEGLSFGYVDVPKNITPAERPFLDMLTEASLNLQREIRKGHEINVKTENTVIPCAFGDIPARVYLPEGDDPHPVILNYHGGGFAIRDIECFDFLSRYYAKNANAMVVTIQYALAPEKKFPVQPEQAYTALLWARENASRYGADPTMDVVLGDSAGGNLSLVVSLMCRDRGEKTPALMIPAYPVVDVREDIGRESEKLYGEHYTLDYKHMKSYNGAYQRTPEDAYDPYMSPLLAEDLTGLEPCRMISAECDILIDQGMEMIQRLKDAGNDAEYHIFKGVPHDFLFYGFPESYEAYDLTGKWIKELVVKN